MDAFVRVLNGVLMIALPVGLGLWFAFKLKTPWSIFFIGSGTFVLSQFGHLPFNQFLLSPLALSSGWVRMDGSVTIVGAILYGLSAGLFEEIARFLVLRFWRKDIRSWGQGLMFGAGHGGIEAMVLGGLALMAFAQAMAVQGTTDLSQLVPVEQVEALQASLDSYWSLPWYAVMLGATERVLALALHLSLSLMVVQVFRRGSSGWLALAIFWHALADALVVFIAGAYGAYVAEGVLALVAAASVGFIFVVRRWSPGEDPFVEEPVLELSPLQKVVHEIDRTDLEESRYQ